MTSRPRFDAERARAAAARLRYSEIRDALEAITIRAESSDNTFTVDMGVGGAILAVNLTGAAMAKTPDQLGRDLLATINDGMHRISQLTDEAVTPYLTESDLDLTAITSGRLPRQPPARSTNEFLEEIEAASRIPKRPMGRFATRPGDPVPGVDDD